MNNFLLLNVHARQIILTAVLAVVFFYEPKAQQANFSAPDSVCVNSPVHITNLSLAATSWNWNFCVSNIDTAPTAINLGNFGTLTSPVFTSIVQDGGNYYTFVMNHLDGHLVCLSFGSSLLNTPTAQDLGTCGVLPATSEGLQVVKAGGIWTAIVVGGNNVSAPAQIDKVDLGPSLASMTPVGTSWGNLGSLDFPTKLYVFLDSTGLYHGFTVNYNSNTLTRFDFGTSFVSPPVGTNLGDLGNMDGPTGLFSIEDAGNWYVFLPNEIGNTLTRLDFGSSLLNVPTAVNLGNPGNVLNGPRDFALVKFCGKTVGFSVNEISNDLVKLDFPTGVAENNPTGVSLGNIGGMDFPHSISTFFQAGSNVYSFVPNVDDGTVTELIFEGCNNQAIPNSTLSTPPTYSYTDAGIYNISLMTDIGLPSQSTYCQSIVVLPPPVISLPADTSFCNGHNVLLSASIYPGALYNWSSGSDSNSVVIDSAGKYWVTVNDYGCTVTDTVLGIANPIPVIKLPADTMFCDSGIVKYVSQDTVTYFWSTQSTGDSTAVYSSGAFWLQLSENGCTASDTVYCTVVKTPRSNLGNDSSFCGPGLLRYEDTAKVTYQWNTGSDSSSTSVPTSGVYWLMLSDQGCISRDSITCSVIVQPSIYLPPDTSFCDSGLLKYVSPLLVTYSWSTGSDSSSTSILSSGLYKLTVNNSGCMVTDSSLCTVTPTPYFSLPKNTNLCGSDILQYNSTLPVTYLWNTGSTSSSTSVFSGGLYWLQLNDNGCVSRDSTIATKLPLPVVNLGNDTTVCLEKGPYILNEGNNPGGYTYDWQDGSTQPSFSVNTPGLYSVIVTLNGCFVSDSVYVAAVLNPIISLGKSQPICTGEDVILKPTPNSLIYTWSNGITDSVFVVTQPGTYYVTGTNDCGSAQDSIVIYQGVCAVHVPNAFTPNGDGINDMFKVLGTEEVDQFVLSIYNRWGERIFETTDKNQGWDGTFHGLPQPIGTYVYNLRFRYELNAQSYLFTGTVTLIR